MADSLIGSEILKLAAEVRTRMAAGERIHNLTVGDFDPAVFPIPDLLRHEIVAAYGRGETNYPPAAGMPHLLAAVAHFVGQRLGLHYGPDELLIAGGARPVIYGIYTTLLDPGDVVVYPTPSWNNNHYVHLARAQGIAVPTRAEDNFMPTAAGLAPHLPQAHLLALCSPQNPTGTVFSPGALAEICELVVRENEARAQAGRKPLYVMYDHIYWGLTHGMPHCDPVSLMPEMRPYTIFVDGISKMFAATGVRLGWTYGPASIMDKMKAIVSHIGAWAPRAEQVATARFLRQDAVVDAYLAALRAAARLRLDALYAAVAALQAAGHPVEAIPPQAAIYLTVKFDLRGRSTPGGQVLHTHEDVRRYLLQAAHMALVPFAAFGAGDSPWYRISVGTLPEAQLAELCQAMVAAVQATR